MNNEEFNIPHLNEDEEVKGSYTIEVTEEKIEPTINTEINSNTNSSPVVGDVIITPEAEHELVVEEIKLEDQTVDTSNNEQTEEVKVEEQQEEIKLDEEAKEPTLENITITEDKKVMLNDKELSNEEIEELINKIENEEEKEKVKNILTKENILIDDTEYKTFLDEDGNLPSVDGTKKLTGDEVKEHIGELAYAALLLKEAKDVEFDENGKPAVRDQIKDGEKVEEVKPEAQDETKSDTNTVNENADETDNRASYVPTGSQRTYAGTGANTINQKQKEPEKTPIIFVDLAQLSGVAEQMTTLKQNFKEEMDSFNNEITNIQNNEGWIGKDKDKFVKQKKSYAKSINEVYTTLEEYTNAINTMKDKYFELEKTLSSKTI